jgi:hypothetical protein
MESAAVTPGPWAAERGSRTCTHQIPSLSPLQLQGQYTGTGCGRGQKHEYGRRDHRSFWAWEHMSAPFPLPMDSFPVCVPSAFYRFGASMQLREPPPVWPGPLGCVGGGFSLQGR